MIRLSPSSLAVVAAAALATIPLACARQAAPPAADTPNIMVDAYRRHVPTAVEVEGIHNAHWLGADLLSGSQPEGPEAFEALSRLGIRTLVSVDGAVPDADEAARHGIRTVHLPVGYDGIPRERQLELLRAGRDLPAPFYVHCHHGKHRGPTAASIIAMGREGWTNEEAEAAMKELGTATEYAGLYACVENFTMPPKDEVDAANGEFPSRTPVGDLAESMVHVDERWESLKLSKAAAWKALADHPDIDPPHEALMLKEAFRELARAGSGLPAGFVEEASRMEMAAADLEAAIRGGDIAAADSAFAAGAASCRACHVDYRNETGALGPGR